MVHLTSEEFTSRFRRAANRRFQIGQACSPRLQKFVETQSEAMGCSVEGFFFPLISCCAACIGPHAALEVTTEWIEPPVFWTLVLARSSFKRVLDKLKTSLLQVEFEAVQKCPAESVRGQHPLLVEYFDFESLHKILCENGGNGIGIYNDVETLRRIVDKSEFGADVLAKLYQSSPWIVSRVQSGHSSLARSAFSLVALADLQTLRNIINSGDAFAATLKDSFFFVCCDEKRSEWKRMDAMKAEPKLEVVFKKLSNLHKNSKLVYKFNSESRHHFSVLEVDTNYKDGGTFRNLARICIVLHVLEELFSIQSWDADVDPSTWNIFIVPDTLLRAKETLDYLMAQKRTLLSSNAISQLGHTLPKRISRTSQLEIDKNLPLRRAPNLVVSRANKVQQEKAMSDRITEVEKDKTQPSPAKPRQIQRSVATKSKKTGKSNKENIYPSTTTKVNENSDASLTPKSCLAACSNDAHEPPPARPFIKLSDTEPDDFVEPPESHEEFVKNHTGSIVKLLTHPDIRLSSYQAVKSNHFPVAQDGQVGYSSKYAMYLMKRLAVLGFGKYSQVANCAYFTKHSMMRISHAAKQILCELGISEQLYQQCFQNRSTIRTDVKCQLGLEESSI